MANAKPDFVLWMVIKGPDDEKAHWVKFGAAWKAKKGYSVRVERCFAPFNDPDIGMAIMPYEDPAERENNNNNQRGGRR